MKKLPVRIFLGLAVAAVFLGHASRLMPIAVIDALESVAYDARLLLTMPRSLDPRVVIVDIDEKSLAAEGRWPWRRDKLAVLLDRLFEDYSAAVVGFDVVFAERDESSGLDVLKALARGELSNNSQFRAAVEAMAPRLDTDSVMANRLKGRPVLLGYYFSDQKAGNRELAIGQLPKPVLAPGTFAGRNLVFDTFPGYGGNLEVLQSAAAGGGHFNPSTDRDGVHRSVPMLVEHRGAYYESLSLAVVRHIAGSPPVQPGFPPESVFTRGYPGLEWVEAGPVRVPVDQRANALVPYRGPSGSFPYVSATDVLNGTASAETLRGRIVLVGTTAPGLQDLRSTPVNPVYPGVEIHANLITGMLDGTIKQKPPYVLGADVLLLGTAGITMAVALPLLTPLWATVVSALTLLVLGGLNLLVWTQANLVLPLASGLLAVFSIWALNMVYGYFVEARAKREIAARFGEYVPPEIVDELARNPGASSSMESVERNLTILFSDVRGFTKISESLDARNLSALMNEYLTPMTRAVHVTRGTIDKYIGDAIVAFWGAPLEDASHASHALQAGLDMQRRLSEINDDFAARGWPRLAVGIGLNTGHVRVGNMGSEVRVAYTVMGDAVNLASRLESLTKHYGVSMLVGEATRAAAPEFVYREIDRVRVVGREGPVTIFEPLGRQGEVPQDVLSRTKLFQQALKFYRAQDWDKAELQFLNLAKAETDTHLCQVFVARIVQLRAQPPGPDWDGVHRLDLK